MTAWLAALAVLWTGLAATTWSWAAWGRGHRARERRLEEIHNRQAFDWERRHTSRWGTHVPAEDRPDWGLL